MKRFFLWIALTLVGMYGFGVFALPFLDVDPLLADEKKEKMIISLFPLEKFENLQQSEKTLVRKIGNVRKEAKLGEMIRFHFGKGYKSYQDVYTQQKRAFLGFSQQELQRQKEYLIEVPFHKLPDQYFEAFIYRFGIIKQYKGGSIALHEAIPHTYQKYSLSCEANTLTDLVNYYHQQHGQRTITERDMIPRIPMESASFLVKNGTRYRGNPEKGFLGRMNGMTFRLSHYKSSLRGWGVLAPAIVPILNQDLNPYNYYAQAHHSTLDQRTLTESLVAGHPVMVRYIYGDEITPMSIIAPDGSHHTLYKNQHVGLIVGAEFDNDMNILNVTMYDGLHRHKENISRSELQNTMKYLNWHILIQEK